MNTFKRTIDTKLNLFPRLFVFGMFMSLSVAGLGQDNGSPNQKITTAPLEVAAIVQDFLGTEIIQVLSNPKRVESFQLDVTQNTKTSNVLAGFPILKQGPDLDQQQIKKFQSLAFNQNSHHFGIEKRCKFSPEMGLLFAKDEDTVEVLFSFSCDMWLFVYKDENKLEDFDSVRQELIEFAHSLFSKTS